MSANTPPWNEVEHTADWALLVRGGDRRELFENAARGMLELIGGEPAADASTQSWRLKVEASDWETLMVEWLTELLFRIEEDFVLITEVQIQQFDAYRLHATIEGRSSHGYHKHIKAVTFHRLDIHPTPDGYETTIVFDV